MTQNLNINPYYDDFDEKKNFYQILFRPGLAVQARELIQMQSILRDQIAKFGDHVFQHGSVVIPGNTFADLSVPYVKINPSYLGNPVDITLFGGKEIVGVTSGVRARIIKAVNATATDPIVFYLNYVSGGVDPSSLAPNGKVVFDDGELIALALDSTKKVQSISAASTGVGSLAYVNSGVYFINGSFVHVEKQSVVISPYDSVPSCRVMLQIVSSIVTANDDVSLLDPAQGSNNFSAPGADRLKIALNLVSLPYGTSFSDDYVELMRYNKGVLEEHSRYPKYNELEKSLARRTYDESGDYVVNGLQTSVRENLRSATNNGYSTTGDINKMTYTVSPGKAYVRGFEVETLAPSNLTVDKARTAAHVLQSSTSLKTTYGQYLYISYPAGKLDIELRPTITFYKNSTDTTVLGTAKAFAIDYEVGDGTNPVYKLYLHTLVLNGAKLEDIGWVKTSGASVFQAAVVSEYIVPNNVQYAPGDTIYVGGSTSPVRQAKVAFFNSTLGKLYAYRSSATLAAPYAGDSISNGSSAIVSTISAKNTIVSSGYNSAVFPLSKSGTKSLKNASNAYDMQYISYRKLTIAVGQTNSNTVVGTILPLEVGNFIALNASGIDTGSYSVHASGTYVIRSAPVPAGSDVTLYVQVLVTNASPRFKNRTTLSLVGVTPATTISLTKADAIQINSIVSTASPGTDLKNIFTLDPNANDFEYGISNIRLNNGATLPGGTLTISFDYYDQTAGDFFTIDSYGLIDRDSIPNYTSPTTGVQYALRDCIDFRQIAGSSTPSNFAVADAVISTSVQRYVGRVDSVCISKQGKLSVLSGSPADIPQPASIPNELIELDRIVVPAWTSSIKQLTFQRVTTTRYTMQNVHSMDDRIGRLEEFATMTAQEAALVKTSVIDAKTGLDRFKTGYVVEDMTDPFGLANSFSPDFHATINSKVGIQPQLEARALVLNTLSTSSNLKIVGNLAMLPYTEVLFAYVPVSSRITNLNPFSVVKWAGNIVLFPPTDFWTETKNLPTIYAQKSTSVTTDVWYGNGTQSQHGWCTAFIAGTANRWCNVYTAGQITPSAAPAPVIVSQPVVGPAQPSGTPVFGPFGGGSSASTTLQTAITTVAAASSAINTNNAWSTATSTTSPTSWVTNDGRTVTTATSWIGYA